MQKLLQCFSNKNVLKGHKKICFKKIGEQAIKLDGGFVEFKNYLKQIAVPLKTYADFQCILKSVVSRSHPLQFFYKLVCVDDKFSKPVFLYRGGNASYKFFKGILQEYEYCKKVMKNHFNKNLIMTEKEEEKFNQVCWMCEKLIEDKKVRGHCQITGEYKGAAHWRCNVNLKLTKKVSIIFHNLKGYDSHLIMNEIGKFNVKVDVIPNVLEKYMVFTINENLVFIDSRKFMNSSLEILVKNLSDDDFKHLTREFDSENLKLLKKRCLFL